jgi:hypothetical protein
VSEPSAPDSFPIGVRAPATITEPGMGPSYGEASSATSAASAVGHGRAGAVASVAVWVC